MRLNQALPHTVHEATNSQQLEKGHIYIAPGGKHLAIENKKGIISTKVFYGEPVNKHRPSVDVLFNSVATVLGEQAIGILLTGMGRDGAEGLLRMRQQGAYTIAQDQNSSVVWGMPGAAVAIGAAVVTLPLNQICQHTIHNINEV